MSKNDTLKGHEIFKSLNVEETHKLSTFSSVKKFNTGENVFECGRPCTHVFMLMSGSVNLRLPGSPAEFSIVVSKVNKGELFGLSPLLDSKRYTTTAQCESDAEVLAIEAKPFRELLKGNCPVAMDVLNRTARIYFARYLDVLGNLQAVVNQIPLMR
ncbi:MAG: cyclic nucleotide-binding domain-containing protein [candidate division Zixibacteria bacterium]|nr:cyclic nucleotide-binding domain-containing protein [candidate division Zixibacteria bacterium]